MSPSRRHEEQRSRLVRSPEDRPCFVVRCSCGWESEPIDAGETHLAWVDHVTGLGATDVQPLDG
jgi:hypothetical protein